MKEKTKRRMKRKEKNFFNKKTKERLKSRNTGYRGSNSTIIQKEEYEIRKVSTRVNEGPKSLVDIRLLSVSDRLGERTRGLL